MKYLFHTKGNKYITDNKENTVKIFKGNPDKEQIAKWIETNLPQSIIGIYDKVWNDYLNISVPNVIFIFLEEDEEPRFRITLPAKYLFKFGKYKGFLKEQVPIEYIKWFVSTIPRKDW